MPPPRKVDLLPAELKGWLRDELVARGFADYEALAEDLNCRLKEAGLELRIQKSAIHAFGQDFRDYAEAQATAQEEIRAFLQEASLKHEVDVTSALFQQLTTIQWRLQMLMSEPGGLPDPRGMKDLTSALNNLIRSTDLREKLVADERRAQSARLEDAVAKGELDKHAAQKAREIMGFV
ncbi:MAG: DUF3486 family protein [Rhodobacteraceae bacterium]|nr:DUF3486 family protein [Paracoccaceae bacterium]